MPTIPERIKNLESQRDQAIKAANELESKIRELTAQRDQTVAGINQLNGGIMALREISGSGKPKVEKQAEVVPLPPRRRRRP